jgi:hypothetical protein
VAVLNSNKGSRNTPQRKLLTTKGVSMGIKSGHPSINSNLDSFTKSIIEDLSSIERHGFASVISVTDGDDFIKKYSDRSRKESRPEWLNGIKKITHHTVNIGHEYENMIRSQLEKLGIDPDSWESESSKYEKKFSNNGNIRQNLKDENQFYVRYFVGVCKNNAYKEVFVNDKGDEVTIDQATKDKWFNGRGGSIKQAAAGIEKEIQPRNLRIENLHYFSMGDVTINRLTDEIMKHLDLEEKK